MPIKIIPRQRQALYTQVLDHLSGIGDFWLAVEAQNYARAQVLGQAFADDLRLLLDDLGWPDRTDLPADGSVELTMPPADLRRVIERLRDEATEMFADALPRDDDQQQVILRTEMAIEACGHVLRAVAVEEAS